MVGKRSTAARGARPELGVKCPAGPPPIHFPGGSAPTGTAEPLPGCISLHVLSETKDWGEESCGSKGEEEEAGAGEGPQGVKKNPEGA